MPGTTMETTTAVAVVALAAVVPAAADPADPPPGNEHASVRMVCSTDALVPGGETLLGLTFEVEEGWHLYWRNNGDSGMPITFDFEAPQGVEIGEARWPVPERYPQMGFLLDYILEDEVTLVFPVRASAELGAESIRITADVRWLVCEEMCLPGEQEVSLDLPVRASARPSPDAGLLSSAARRMPVPMDDYGPDRVRSSWSGNELVMVVPGATALTFYPYESETLQPEDMVERGTVTGNVLRIAYPAKVEDAPSVAGVLEVDRGGKKESVIVDVPGPGAG